MAETNYIKRVHSHLPVGVYKWKIRDDFHGGVADAYYDGPKGLVFVEYKFVKTLPKRQKTFIKPKLSELQKEWLGQRHRNGVPTIVIVGSTSGGYVYNCPSAWERGVPLHTFLTGSLSHKEIADYIAHYCI